METARMLVNYLTGEAIRPATADEAERSDAEVIKGKPEGVIAIELASETLYAYVEDDE